MTSAKMAVANAYTHAHCRCYYRLRSIVRVTFWSAIIFGVLLVCGWVDSLPEF